MATIRKLVPDKTAERKILWENAIALAPATLEPEFKKDVVAGC